MLVRVYIHDLNMKFIFVKLRVMYIYILRHETKFKHENLNTRLKL